MSDSEIRRLDDRVDGIGREAALRVEAAEARLRGEIERARSDLMAEIVALKARMRVLEWMMGFVLAFQVAIFVKLFLG